MNTNNTQNKTKRIKNLSGKKFKIFKEAYEKAGFGFQFSKSFGDTHEYGYTFEGRAFCTYNGYNIEIPFKSNIDYCSTTKKLLGYACELLLCEIDGTKYQIADVKLGDDVAWFINNVCIETI
jgi:hypothetical protein